MALPPPVTPGSTSVCGGVEEKRSHAPFAKPSAAPWTASAALTPEAKAAATAAKKEYFMIQLLQIWVCTKNV